MSSEKTIKLSRDQYRQLMKLESEQKTDAPKNDLGASLAPISKTLTLSKASVQSVANSLAITLMVLSESEAILRRADRTTLADDLATEAQRLKAVKALIVTDEFDGVNNARHNTFGSKKTA